MANRNFETGLRNSLLRMMKLHAGVQELAHLLHDLPDKVRSRASVDPIAFVSVHVREEASSFRPFAAVAMLAFEGAAEEEARLFAKKIEVMGMGIDKNAARLMTQPQLEEVFGPVYGHRLAQILLTPESFPFEYFFLYGDDDPQVAQILVRRVVEVRVTLDPVPYRLNEQPDWDNTHVGVEIGDVLPRSEAQYVYSQLCGCPLADTVQVCAYNPLPEGPQT